MPLVSVMPLLAQAREERYIVPSFNVYNLETAFAVLSAAEAERSPLIVAVAEAHFPTTDFEILAAALRTLADRAKMPVVLHLDHAETLDIIARAMRAGFTSFQFDGYGLPFEERMRQTRSVVDLAHSLGHGVEAELGHMTKVGEDADQRDNMLANPGEAAGFVKTTGVDIVAAAVGTVHGLAPGSAAVDFDRLASIVSSVPAFVSLHGGSGMPDADVRRAIELGVVKMSYFTGLSEAASKAVGSLYDAGLPALSKISDTARAAFGAKAVERMRVFGSSGRA
jgi:ketose-bisphosphate aldolase